MGIGVESLIELRNRTLDDFVDGRLERDEFRAGWDAHLPMAGITPTRHGDASPADKDGACPCQLRCHDRQSSCGPERSTSRARPGRDHKAPHRKVLRGICRVLGLSAFGGLRLVRLAVARCP